MFRIEVFVGEVVFPIESKLGVLEFGIPALEDAGGRI